MARALPAWLLVAPGCLGRRGQRLPAASPGVLVPGAPAAPCRGHSPRAAPRSRASQEPLVPVGSGRSLLGMALGTPRPRFGSESQSCWGCVGWGLLSTCRSRGHAMGDPSLRQPLSHSLLLFVDEADAFLRKRATVSVLEASVWRGAGRCAQWPRLASVSGCSCASGRVMPESGQACSAAERRGSVFWRRRSVRGLSRNLLVKFRFVGASGAADRLPSTGGSGHQSLTGTGFSLQEKISEDLRATLNAFLHRTGQHSSK